LGMNESLRGKRFSPANEKATHQDANMNLAPGVVIFRLSGGDWRDEDSVVKLLCVI
jgi:hypothetical protein